MSKQAQRREYYRRNREDIIARVKEYDKNHRRQRLQYFRDYYQQNKQRIRERQRIYSKQNRTKRLVKERARYHVPLGDSCSECGATENLERHHHDYSRPLDIVTLCHSCHVLLHNREEA